MIPEASHPIWPIVRIVVLQICLNLALSHNYESGFVLEKDGKTQVQTLIIHILAELRNFKRDSKPDPTTGS